MGVAPPFTNRGHPWNNGPPGNNPRFMSGPPRFNNRMPPFPPIMPPMMNQQPPLLEMRHPQGNQSTIKIDNVNREIRYYDDVAIVFMDWDQPKEIGFEPGTRRITCDEKWSMNLSFNAPNVTWMIEGRPHQVRLGAPTRELFIDNEWYECYIGDPCRIEMDGKVRTLFIEGPAPKVRIGDLRTDLVAGKINIIIDAKIMVPVYLDSREQQFEIDGHVQTLQFADYFLTVLINKEPIPVEFGGLPRSFFVNGQKHFMRFTALPAGVVPGRFFVHGMLRTPLNRHIPSPPPPHHLQPNILPINNMMMSHPPPALMMPPPLTVPPPVAAVPNSLTNGLDLLTNIIPGLASPAIPVVDPPTVGYNVESSNGAASAPAGGPAAALGNVNINDLFQKLLATGILNKNTAAATTAEGGNSPSQANEASVGGNGTKRNNHHRGDPRKKDKGDHAAKGGGSSAPILTKEKIVPVDLSKPATIKTRQLAIVQQVYLGMQCSSCGVRFPPEQTMKYSQHLDWHFRQNRRDRDSVRKAHSRKWFYDVDNWIQYEEIEDLEERGKSRRYGELEKD